jgi:rhodanese-related sulfurtransferase
LDAAVERSEEEPSEAPLDLELEAAEVARRLREAPEGIVLLDIREPHELRQGHAVGAWLLPMNSVPQRLTELPRDKTLAVYCAAGVRSYGVSHWLREQGFVDTWSVPGGLGALAHEGVETTFPPFGTTPTLLARVRLASGVEGEVQQVSATDDGLRLHVRVPSTSGSEVFAGVDAGSVEPL